ncbi:hypothetical protein [Aquibacillus sediminis]|uniref:hypothetical protein n=1 Tax=Aquibacillus sediminis TaxID=2574734 RepID=UPI001108C21B|nr:hypothetical protein [Aquibacillus sediminis]
MKRFKFVLLLFLLSLFATACSEPIPEGFYDYNKEKVEAAVNELSFQPQLPKFVPIEVDFLISDQYQDTETEAEALDVSFYTSDNDLLSIQFINGEAEGSFFQPEQIQIDEQVSGQYVDNTYAKILFWHNDHITYKMTYRASADDRQQQQNNKVTKNDLLKVAQSFDS